jgi:hypothetical protein
VVLIRFIRHDRGLTEKAYFDDGQPFDWPSITSCINHCLMSVPDTWSIITPSEKKIRGGYGGENGRISKKDPRTEQDRQCISSNHFEGTKPVILVLWQGCRDDVDSSQSITHTQDLVKVKQDDIDIFASISGASNGGAILPPPAVTAQSLPEMHMS